jgi:type IV secretion system protein VirB6
MSLAQMTGSLFDRGFSMPTLLGNVGDMLYYAVIYKFVQGEVRSIGPAIMHNFMNEIAIPLALVLMTIWVFWQGLRIFSGQSRESMMEFVLKAARNAFIVTAATTMSFIGFNLHTLLTDTLDKTAVLLMTGEDDTRSTDMIEENLLLTQAMLASMDLIKVGSEGNVELNDEKTRASLMAGFGALGPGVTGSAMLLMYEIAMAFFIGFGPLFILCLMFKQTETMFWKWLYYGFATTFSMAALALMTTLALKVTAVVVTSFWLSAVLSGPAGANLTQGMSSLAMQQGGIGLILTVMLISVPPIAGNFFSMALGQFQATSMFGMGAGAAAAAQQQQQQAGGGGQRPPINQSIRGEDQTNTARPNLLSQDAARSAMTQPRLALEGSSTMVSGQRGLAQKSNEDASPSESRARGAQASERRDA